MGLVGVIHAQKGGRKMNKPDCYSCVYRGSIPGDAHSCCAKHDAKVTAHEHGKKMGWFSWPFNFDPVWLISCDSFKGRDNDPECEDAA